MMQLAMFSKREAQTRVVDDFFIDDDRQLSNPVLKRFDAVWRAGSDLGRLPGRGEIDPSAIPDLLPHIMLVDVIRDEDDMVEFRSRLVGQHQVGIDGRAGAGECLFANPDEANQMVGVVASGRPHYSRCRVEGAMDNVVEYERATYPLSSNGIDVDSVASVLVPHTSAARKSRLHTFLSWF